MAVRFRDPWLLWSPEHMGTEDAPHLLDRVRLALRGVARAYNCLGGHAVQVRALVRDHPIVAGGDGPLATHRDDGVGDDPWGERARRKRPDEAMPGAHVVHGSWDA